MRKSVYFFAAALTLLGAADARAQWGLPVGGRLIVNVNLGVQPASQDVGRTATFTLYDEPAEVSTAQEVSGGALFEVGATWKLRDRWGVGLSYTSLSSDDPATISGSLPHPLFFGQPRTFSQDAGGLDHKEQAIHVQAVWFYPFIDKVDLAFSAGPSFFTVTQGFARGVSFSENPPDFNTVTIDSVDTANLEENAVGFNIGAEATYAITANIGAGVLMRYTRATADFDLGEGQTAEIKAGSFQIGAGLRFRF